MFLLVHGCCGTTANHIKAISDVVEGLEPRKIPAKLTKKQYIESLLPSALYDRSGSSEFLAAIHKMDPLHIRNENVDMFFVDYENDELALNVFKEDLKEYENKN